MRELSEKEWHDLKNKLDKLIPGWHSDVGLAALDGKIGDELRGIRERLDFLSFSFQIKRKLTTHKQTCSLCGKEIFKGEKRVRLIYGASESYPRFLLFSYFHFTCLERFIAYHDEVETLVHELRRI